MRHLLFTLLLLPALAQAGNPDADSLRNCLRNCPDQADRLRALSLYVDQSIDHRENISLLDSTLNILKRTGGADTVLQRFYFKISLQYYLSNQFRESIAINNKIRKLALKQADTNAVIRANTNLNILYYRLSKPDSSFYYLHVNYELLKNSRDTFSLASNLNGLGLYYANRMELGKAREYFRQMYRIGEKSGPDLQPQIFKLYYGNMGNLYLRMEDTDSAEYFLKRKLEISPGDLGAINDLGSLYRRKENYPQALKYYGQVYREGKATGNLYFVTGSANNLAVVHNLLSQPQKALAYAREAEEGALDLHRTEWLEVSLNQQLIANKELGRFSTALALSERIRELSDSVNSREVQERVAELETSYALKEKTTALEISKARNKVQELQLSRQRWNVRVAVIFLIILFLTAGTVLIYNQHLRKTRRALAEANSVKDRFFALVAHDMLGGISSFSGIGPMLKEMADEGDYRGIAAISQDMEEESLRVKKMLDDLLQWAFLQLDRVTMRPEKLEVSAQISQRMEELSRPLAAKQITIETDLREKFVLADAGAMAFILRNLLGNAIKFSFPGGRIAVSCERRKGELVVSVADEGTGMSPATLAKLFNPAEKVTHSGTSGEPGNGLGLILSQEFARRNGGRIEAESTPGRGSVFRLMLPV